MYSIFIGMIKTIIFDFGNVFINLDKVRARHHAMNLYGIDAFSKEMIATNTLFETGLISSTSFLDFYQNAFPRISKENIIDSWNIILKDFPLRRLDFLKQLSNKNEYKLILLSNTNELHMKWVREHIPLYNDFKNCFDEFYLSHEIHLRKPNDDIFEFVIQHNDLIENEILFIDDTFENIQTAEQLGLYTWNLNPKEEDITDLFSIKKELF